jgi:cell division protein FtsZ
MMDTKDEAPEENVVVFEFETKEVELSEELIEEETFIAEVAEEPLMETPVAELQEELMTEEKGEEKEEETFVVFNVKSYENNTPEPVSKTVLDQQLNDRKRILSQLSHRSLNKNNMSELENTPAYLRKGVEVQNVVHSTANEMSRYSIGEDTINQRPEVKKNNSFLHDNVD